MHLHEVDKLAAKQLALLGEREREKVYLNFFNSFSSF